MHRSDWCGTTDRVDDVGRGHLRYHGHDVDERDAMAPHAGRHNLQYSTVQYSTVQYSTVQYSTVQHGDRHHLHRELEADIHGVGREESPQVEDRQLGNPVICSGNMKVLKVDIKY